MYHDTKVKRKASWLLPISLLLLVCFVTMTHFWEILCLWCSSTFPHWMMINWGWKTSSQGCLWANGFIHAWVWISCKYSRPVATGASLTHGFVGHVATGRLQLPRRHMGQWLIWFCTCMWSAWASGSSLALWVAVTGEKRGYIGLRWLPTWNAFSLILCRQIGL